MADLLDASQSNARLDGARPVESSVLLHCAQALSVSYQQKYSHSDCIFRYQHAAAYGNWYNVLSPYKRLNFATHNPIYMDVTEPSFSNYQGVSRPEQIRYTLISIVTYCAHVRNG